MERQIEEEFVGVLHEDIGGLRHTRRWVEGTIVGTADIYFLIRVKFFEGLTKTENSVGESILLLDRTKWDLSHRIVHDDMQLGMLDKDISNSLA